MGSGTGWVARGLTVLCLVGLAHAGWEAWEQRRRMRDCFGAQRRLQVMIDNLGSANVDAPMDDIFGRLVAAGSVGGQMGRNGAGTPVVIALELEDPGGGRGSFGNYVLMAGSRMVGCTVHGSAFLGER